MSQSSSNTTAGAIERSISLSGIEAQLNFLQGEILTLAESSFSDKDQCKAFKDLVRQFFRSRIRWIGEVSSTPNQANRSNSHMMNRDS